jgi:hypothetical protein
MSYKPTPEEISEDLPRAIGQGHDMKSQLLCVAEILRLFTDQDHGLTADEIREAVGLRTGKTPTAAKVLSDIHSLAGNSPFGMEISIPSRGDNRGFRCERAFLSSDQARLTINMVRTCKFVTRQQRDDLCEALFSMVSYYQQDQIARGVTVDERELPQTPDVFSAAEVFSMALEKDEMVSFEYVAKGLDGKEYPSKNSLDGSYILHETPIALIYSYGNYYAETWSGSLEEGRVMVRRLDRVRSACLSGVKAVTGNEIERLRSTVQERIGQTFDMYGEGDAKDLFLKVEASAARYIYDRFGYGVKFSHVAPDGQFGYIHVVVKLSATFYRWLFGMGERIILARPQGALWESLFPSLRLRKKPHAALVNDYEDAIRGLRRQMSLCASAYGWQPSVSEDDLDPSASMTAVAKSSKAYPD